MYRAFEKTFCVTRYVIGWMTASEVADIFISCIYRYFLVDACIYTVLFSTSNNFFVDTLRKLLPDVIYISFARVAALHSISRPMKVKLIRVAKKFNYREVRVMIVIIVIRGIAIRCSLSPCITFGIYGSIAGDKSYRNPAGYKIKSAARREIKGSGNGAFERGRNFPPHIVSQSDQLAPEILINDFREYQ